MADNVTSNPPADGAPNKPAAPDKQAGAADPSQAANPLLADVIDIPTPETRPLRCYAFDPSHGKFFGNEMTLHVKYEKLLPGPIGERVAVIDYDGENETFYKPVDLENPNLLIRSGLNPSESDPRFHQQMVYAVASETIQNFEAALGRRIRWRLDERIHDEKGELLPGTGDGDIYRLNLYPHAMVAANAAYSPSAKGILFGYFRASTNDPGRNLPGQTVFTCLSHDIIVHEMTHAILDGIRTYFSERTSPDVAAFHEAFADIVALFRHFSHKEALLDTIQKTGGKLYQYHLEPDAFLAEGNPVIQAQKLQDNPLIGLAQQFGEARGTGRALRSALSELPNPKKIKDPSLEPHERGAILVAAIFDAYFTVYLRQTADLFRIFHAGGGSTHSSELSGPMANLLAKAASKTAEILFKICVRAIDYCPAVDINFGDYLRSLITADRDNHPADPLGIRDAFMQAFRLRGILPDDAQYFAEESLSWSPVPPGEFPAVKDLKFGDPNGLTEDEKDHNGDVLRQYAKDNVEKLGFRPNNPYPITVPSFHPACRFTPDGRMRIDMVVEMAQKTDIPFDPKRPELGTFPMRSGSTLLITKPPLKNGEFQDGQLRYLIRKRLDGKNGEKRQSRQRDFSLREGLLEGNEPSRFQMNFNMLHSGL
ncbi:MAG TPA: hypothetical protein VN643_16850 [Pyrinomonadaceae bacterium]|nr:hypothetical protein [Pyrinomonadaceae bacterium]